LVNGLEGGVGDLMDGWSPILKGIEIGGVFVGAGWVVMEIIV